ncbi:conserved hypothetical protein [Bradyrhizobium sp. STM 3843]|uniref:hypothetical protein n=1 Tax=Bradyrhizobium sp. STM 3843 TaxID=551947 RepID=UPI0002403CB9|nr:hypothetical protein [Bradyrhizobium sp. STM 3843]CCE07897.1 conserved hypothetical protein [Bradyrhizobium sp. STM 3843]
MSEQAEQTSAGAVVAEPVANPTSPAETKMMDAAMPAAEVLQSPRIAPDHEAPTADVPRIEVKADGGAEAVATAKTDAAEADMPKPEASKAEASKPEHTKPEHAKSADKPAELAASSAAKPTLTILELTKPAQAKVEPIKAETPNVEPPKLSALGASAPKIGAASSTPPKLDVPPKRLIMSHGVDGAAGDTVGAGAERGAAAAKAKLRLDPFKFDGSAKTAAPDPAPAAAKPNTQVPPASVVAGRRGTPAIAAMFLLAMLAGGIGGAAVTMALGHGATEQPAATAAADDPSLAASVARIDSDLATVKAGLEQTNQTSLVELNKAAERLDKLEKVQGELAAKLAKPSELQKLSDAVDRLRAAQASAAAQATARETAREPARDTTRDTTASVAPAQLASAAPTASAQAAAPKLDASRPKIVEGWVLRNVGRGAALIEGRDGLYEVYAGDPVPGLGKVDAIKRQDGRWVVVTTRGLVVSR